MPGPQELLLVAAPRLAIFVVRRGNSGLGRDGGAPGKTALAS